MRSGRSMRSMYHACGAPTVSNALMLVTSASEPEPDAVPSRAWGGGGGGNDARRGGAPPPRIGSTARQTGQRGLRRVHSARHALWKECPQ